MRVEGDSEVEGSAVVFDQVPPPSAPWPFCDRGCEGILYGPYTKNGRPRGSVLAPARCTRNFDRTCFGG